MEIGSRIRELRNARNMTQKDLADLLFVTPQAVSRWEAGSAEPSLDMINKITTHFSVTVDYLLGKETQYVPKKTVPMTEKVIETRPVLAVCESCNTPLYEGRDIVRTTSHRARGGSTTHVICATCSEKKRKAQLEYSTQEGIKNRIRSYILGGIITAVVLAIALWIVIPTRDPMIITIGAVIGVLTFPFAGCLFLRNNFVGGMVGSIFDWGFIKMPGLIFSLDLDGIIWFLTVKLLFWILGVLVAVGFLLLGISLGLIVSVFVYPFALKKNYECPEDFEV